MNKAGPGLKWRTAYGSLALVVFNMALFFLLIEGLSRLILGMLDPVQTHDRRIITHFGEDKLKEIYPGRTWNAIRSLLGETWSRPHVYEPFVQFREAEVSGQAVQVTRAGFRRHHATPQPWPPDPKHWNAFLFGGSTVFGYGVAGEDTIAANLEQALPRMNGRKVQVYNFGQGFYYSSQELIQFQRLLVSGHRPDAAIFLDGLNDFFHERDQPFYTERLRRMMSSDPERSIVPRIPELAVVRLTHKVLPRIIPESPPPPPETSPILHAVIDRYLANQRLIRAAAAAFDVRTLFAWQPVPVWHHQPGQHLVRGELTEHPRVAPGYELFFQRLQRQPSENQLIWCAEVQTGIHELLYVDRVHYNSRMNALIARCLADGL
ncbi:MAG: SGNH/GDSL hydrolase family protein [Magnetococcales bacterium]|nr:SGNH/GDSL hydrolase family protein [Magnetococcales bacterium]